MRALHAWECVVYGEGKTLCWQAFLEMHHDCRFHHFVGYGAVYFSYPYAVALSSAIWQQHFPDGRMHRASGLLHDLSGSFYLACTCACLGQFVGRPACEGQPTSAVLKHILI